MAIQTKIATPPLRILAFTSVVLTGCIFDPSRKSGADAGDMTTSGVSSTSTTATTSPTSSSSDGAVTFIDDPATTGSTTDVTTGAGSTSSGATDDSTGEQAIYDCESYCAVYDDGCVDFSEYSDTTECLAQCAQWPVGMLGETATDSLGCRFYHAAVANMGIDPALHCPHAGPSGAGICISPDAPTCDGYCSTYLANCADQLSAYNDLIDCMGQCASWYPDADNQTVGDSVACREYHAAVAVDDPPTHCPHAGPDGGGVCVTQQ